MKESWRANPVREGMESINPRFKGSHSRGQCYRAVELGATCDRATFVCGCLRSSHFSRLVNALSLQLFGPRRPWTWNSPS